MPQSGGEGENGLRVRKEIEEKNPEYFFDRDNYIARAAVSKKHRNTGEEYYVLSSSCNFRILDCTTADELNPKNVSGPRPDYRLRITSAPHIR